jgi:NAD(P)-dependent dehydrogenase (short-subunit alcohol dehydrogenase family)
MASTQKIALVTGGNRGLGKDMALALARKGIDVVITYKNNESLAQETAKAIEALGRKCFILPLDMKNFKALPQFNQSFFQLLKDKWNVESFDFLINNAGMGATVPIEKVTEDVFDDFLNVHFKSVYFLTQACLPRMNSGGRVINISSGTTRFSNPGYSVYASMKGAIEVLTKYIAKEYGAKGIGANVVAPGPIETDFNNAAIRSNPQFKQMLGSMTALGRVGVAEDLGGVVAFLCSEEGRWINGQRIEVSGGINV